MAASNSDAPEPGLALARKVGQGMMERDHATRLLDITLEEVRPGFARMSMRVRPDMLNGHGSCHGGYIFTLADSAFAYACNSRNESSVAAACQIEYLLPGRAGALLTAEAQEQLVAGRSGIYDARVTDETGAVLAMFRGKSHRLKGETVLLDTGG